jgi:hypothetical protein
MPRSIGGFNSSTYGSFGTGQPISAGAMNRMAIAVDRASTMMSQGIDFRSSNNGVAYSSSQEVVSVQSYPPFTVFLDSVDGITVVRVSAGSVNSVIPLINGTIMTGVYTPLTAPLSAGTYVVAIKCKADPAPAFFPLINSEIVVIAYPTTDTDTEGYIALSVLTATSGTGGTISFGLNQLVSGSLTAERHKYSAPNTASYYYYRV